MLWLAAFAAPLSAAAMEADRNGPPETVEPTVQLDRLTHYERSERFEKFQAKVLTTGNVEIQRVALASGKYTSVDKGYVYENLSLPKGTFPVTVTVTYRTWEPIWEEEQVEGDVYLPAGTYEAFCDINRPEPEPYEPGADRFTPLTCQVDGWIGEGLTLAGLSDVVEDQDGDGTPETFTGWEDDDSAGARFPEQEFFIPFLPDQANSDVLARNPRDALPLFHQFRGTFNLPGDVWHRRGMVSKWTEVGRTYSDPVTATFTTTVTSRGGKTDKADGGGPDGLSCGSLQDFNSIKANNTESVKKIAQIIGRYGIRDDEYYDEFNAERRVFRYIGCDPVSRVYVDFSNIAGTFRAVDKWYE